MKRNLLMAAVLVAGAATVGIAQFTTEKNKAATPISVKSFVLDSKYFQDTVKPKKDSLPPKKDSLPSGFHTF
jgi:hypothetical protein